MPMITLRYATLNQEQGLNERLAVAASHLAATALGKDPGVTAVLVEPAPAANWFVAGRSLEAQALAAFWLDIKITAGTNTKAETGRFVREAFGAMEALLGPLHPESYVLVHAVDGDAYGYGGRTQNGRWAAAHPG